jgi:putative flippase GtrA
MVKTEAYLNQDHTKSVVGLRKSLVRAVMTSLSATMVDFFVSIFLNGILNVYYVTATSIGGLCGAATSFFMGRVWVFKKKTNKLKNQLLKFIFTNLVSIFLNTSGVFFIKEHFDLPFFWSRILISVCVGFFFNFLMNRFFVFKS